MPDPSVLIIPSFLGSQTSLELNQLCSALIGFKVDSLINAAILGFDRGALVACLDKAIFHSPILAFLGEGSTENNLVSFEPELRPGSFEKQPDFMILDTTSLSQPWEPSLLEAAFCSVNSHRALVLVRSYDLSMMKAWLPYFHHEDRFESHLNGFVQYWESVEQTARNLEFKPLERRSIRMPSEILHGFDLCGWWESVKQTLNLDESEPVSLNLANIEEQGLGQANLDIFVKENLYYKGQ